MLWRVFIGISVVAILAGGVRWVSDGMHIFSKDKEQQVTEVRDELFGTTNRIVTWVPAYKYGLLPLDAVPSAIPGCYATVLAIGGILILYSVRKLRKPIQNT